MAKARANTDPKGASKGARFVKASIVKRFLGHFGVGPSTIERSNGSRAKANPATKSIAKKTVSK